MELQEKKLKKIMKAALKEALREERSLMYDVMTEVMEDLALAKAIDEGMKSKEVEPEEIFKILKVK